MHLAPIVQVRRFLSNLQIYASFRMVLSLLSRCRITLINTIGRSAVVLQSETAATSRARISMKTFKLAR